MQHSPVLADCGTKTLFLPQSYILFSDMAGKTCYTHHNFQSHKAVATDCTWQLSRGEDQPGVRPRTQCTELLEVACLNYSYNISRRYFWNTTWEQSRSPAAELFGPTGIWEVPQSIQTNMSYTSSLVSRMRN